MQDIKAARIEGLTTGPRTWSIVCECGTTIGKVRAFKARRISRVVTVRCLLLSNCLRVKPSL